MENFGMIYEKMNLNYSTVENMMSTIYLQMQETSSNQQLEDVLQELGNIANGLISSQMEFAELYCNPDLKESLMNNLYDKQNALLSSLNKNKTL